MDFPSKFYFVTTDIYISLREFTGSTRWNNARNIKPPQNTQFKTRCSVTNQTDISNWGRFLPAKNNIY